VYTGSIPVGASGTKALLRRAFVVRRRAWPSAPYPDGAPIVHARL
jgi:hypothetical protein